MKKRKLISIILALALALSLLAGCGGKNGDDPKEPSGNKPGEPTVEEHPEFVWASEFTPVKGEFTNGIDNMLYCNGKLLVSMYEKIADNTPEDVIPEWEGQYWVYGTRLYWLGMDGTLAPIEGYQPIEAPEDKEGDSYLQKLMSLPDGSFATVECVYSSWYDGPDDLEMWSDEWWDAGYYEEYYHNEQHYYLRLLAEDGSETARIDLAGLQEQMNPDTDYFYVNDVAADANGNFYFACEQAIGVMDSAGKMLGVVRGESEDIWFDRLVPLSDGVYASYWAQEKGEVLAPIDPAALTLGEPAPVRNAYNTITAPQGSEYDYYYTDGSNLMACDLKNDRKEKILNWINCDVETNGGRNTCVLPDGSIVTVQTQYDDDYRSCTIELVTLKQVPYDSVPHKTPLTLATQYLNYQTRSSILKFNRSNPNYRIELRDYSEYNTEEDYSAGLTKLTAEIMAGNVPDIIDLNGLPLDRMVNKGLLADLYPLMDADAELSRDAIMPAVLKTLENDGRLYRTAASFAVSTLLGAASIVGNTPGWTLAEFKEALAKMPEGCTPLEEYQTRGSILYNMLSMEMSNLIDWNTGKCYFDSPIFRDILEFAAQFPETFEYPEDYVWTEENEVPNRIATGRQMLVMNSMYDFESFQMYDAMFGGRSTAIGYPVSEGVGNALEIWDSGYAISAKCAAPEAAWQFVRTFFTEDYQADSYDGFPSNKAAFDRKLKDAMTPEYQKDEKGNFVLDENGEKIEISHGGWGWGSLEVEFYALKQDEADRILEIINSAERITGYDESQQELLEIITTDTEAYFLGQKSLDEVVRLLQSKLNILINEQR